MFKIGAGAGSRRFKFRHPISAETHMWGRRLAAMLALYTSKCVVPEVNLREHISPTPPPGANKAVPTLTLKPRGDVTRSPKQGYQWPHKWTCQQKSKINWVFKILKTACKFTTAADALPLFYLVNM